MFATAFFWHAWLAVLKREGLGLEENLAAGHFLYGLLMWALFATGCLGAIVVHASDLSAAHAPACYQGILARQEVVEFIRGEPALEKYASCPRPRTSSARPCAETSTRSKHFFHAVALVLI